MNRWSLVPVLAVVVMVTVNLRAQSAPALIEPTPVTSSTPSGQRPPECAAPYAYDAGLRRCMKPSVVPTMQAPEAHREEKILVSKSKWEQMGADLERAAQRILQLKRQAADLRKQMDDLKRNPGCGG